MAKLFHKHVGLDVTASAQTRRLDSGFESDSGTRFVLVTVHIDNGTSESFAVPATAFSLTAASGLAFEGTEASNALQDGCRGDVTLTRHAELDCTVVFQVPLDQEPEKITLTTPEERTGNADVALTPCQWCVDTCVELATDREHCGSCGESLDSDQECVAGERVCSDPGETLCGRDCVDLMADTEHCGACNAALPAGAECDDGEAICPTRGDVLCADGCTDVDEDRHNCGECGRSCDRGECVNGTRCEDYTQTNRTETCDSACDDIGYTCDYAIAYYGGSDFHERPTACDEIPPASDDSGWSFYALGCFCELRL